MKTYKTCVGETPNCSNSLSVTAYNTGDHSMDTYYVTLPGSTMDYIIKSLTQALDFFDFITLKFPTSNLKIDSE